jgi:hypothetical protein
VGQEIFMSIIGDLLVRPPMPWFPARSLTVEMQSTLAEKWPKSTESIL